MLDEYRADATWCGSCAGDGRLRCAKPAGAFYLFLDVDRRAVPDGLRTSAHLARALLDEARVAFSPGEAFDAPGFLRSVATRRSARSS